MISFKREINDIDIVTNVGHGDLIDLCDCSFKLQAENLRLITQKKWVTHLLPYFYLFFKSFTSFFMLTTSVLTLSMFLSMLPILSFINVRLFVISLLAAIDSLINGTIYLYRKKHINKHIVIGKPTLLIKLIT